MRQVSHAAGGWREAVVVRASLKRYDCAAGPSDRLLASQKEVGMSRAEVETDIRETLGIVPSFFAELPDNVFESEWTTFKNFQLAETAIPNKYKELIGLAVSGATRCKYCAYFHTEAAKLFGATEEEVLEAAFMAKHTMGWSTYLNAREYDYDEFKREFDQIAAHVQEQMAVTA